MKRAKEEVIENAIGTQTHTHTQSVIIVTLNKESGMFASELPKYSIGSVLDTRTTAHAHKKGDDEKEQALKITHDTKNLRNR